MFAAIRSRHPAVLGLALSLVVGACQNADVTDAVRPSGGGPLADATGGNSPGARRCQKDGWTQLMRADLSAFGGEGDCVSYVAMAGLFGQTITFTSTNPSPVHIGDAGYTPQASASSGLPVTLTLDAASTGCTLSGGLVSFTSAGTCLIDANQAGDALFAAAPQAQQSISVIQKTQTLSFTSTNPSPVHVGDPGYTPTATATSGLAVTFSLDAVSTGCSLSSGVVSFTAVGTCVIDANQAGDATWAAAPQVQQSIRVTVNPALYCASIGGTYDEPSTGYLWTCNGWTASSLDDAKAKADLLAAACRADNGATTGGFDYTYTAPFPTEVDSRCHLPE